MDWAIWACGVGSVLVASGTAVYVAFSGPIATRQLLKDILRRVDDVERKEETMTLRWQEYREGLEGFVERLEDAEARSERNRRRAAAAEARSRKREEGGNGAAFDPSDRQSLRQAARQRGFDV